MGQQLSKVGLGHHVGKFVVRDPRQHQPHIHAAVGGDTQRPDHRLINGQIGRCDPHIALGIADKLLIGILGGVDRIIIRTVHQRLAEISAYFSAAAWAVGIPWIPQLTAHAQPQMHELPGEAPGPLPLQPQAAVLPVTEAHNEVGIFIRQIGSAGVGNVSVNDGDLPVVTVVEVQPVHILVHGVEHLHPDTLLPQSVDLLRGHGHHTAEIVQNQIHFHPGSGALRQDFANAVPDLSLGGDVILQEDEPLRLFHLSEQVLQIRLAGRKIGHLRVFEQREVLPPQVLRQLAPPGPAPCEITLRPGAAFPHRRGLLRHGQRLQRQLLLHLVAVPEPVKDHSHHRHQHDQDNPAGLIGAAAGPCIDPGHAEHRHDLQNGVSNVDLLLEHHAQSHHHCDLQQQ